MSGYSQKHINIRNQIISLVHQYTLNPSLDVKHFRKSLQPFLNELEMWYIHNRPDNEITMTKGSWKSIWYDDADIDDRGSIKLNKNKIWQVIGDNYYYNVSENRIGNCCRFTNYLQGSFTISNKPNTLLKNLKKLNTIDLQFVYNGIRPNELHKGANLTKLVENVEKGSYFSSKNALSIPGPIGVKGELWNFYLDDKYRFAYGININDPETIDIYILEKNNIIE